MKLAKTRRWEKMLGAEAPKINYGSITFRDLNKNGKLDIYEDPRRPVDERVEDLISQMTVEEKCGLMFSPMLSCTKPDELHKKGGIFTDISALEAIAKKNISTFACMGSAKPKDFALWHNAFQKAAERTRLGIPVTLCSDPRHVYVDKSNPAAVLLDAGVSSWPCPLGLAATRDEELVESFGKIAAQELCSMGIRFALHPVSDTATEPRWCRIQETFGESAELNGKMSAAYVRGFQGKEIGEDSVACCVKHFPGGGPQKDGEDPHCSFGKDQVYPGGKFEYHLSAFEKVFEESPAAVMPYYGKPIGLDGVEEVGFNFNKQITNDLLRDRMGFNGVVHTDYGIICDKKVLWTKMPARAWGIEHYTIPERLIKALDASVDQLGGTDNAEDLVALVKSGKVSEERINESCRRVLSLKFRLGLFDNPYIDPEKTESVCGRADFVAAGDDAMRKSLVLLENKNVLPLKDNRPKVYIENIDEAEVSKYADVVKRPKDADFAIVHIKSPFEFDSRELMAMMFEGGSLEYSKKQKKKLDKIMSAVPTIVIIKLTRPAIIPEIKEKAAGIIAEFGTKDSILLEAVFGKFAPIGKLPFDLPSSMKAVVDSCEDTPFDTKDPLFKFGFGLTYSE